MFQPDKLYFVPLGGAGEIGMNLNAYGCNNKWVIVDLGITFGHKLGIDVIVPDITFFEGKKLLGIVVTHGHEDHIGAIPYVWKYLRCSIYATPFTASLVRRKLREAGLDEGVVEAVPMEGQLKLGAFKFRFINITHSIPEPNVLAIETPKGTMVHTGDWKIDPDPLVGNLTDTKSLAALGDKDVLALVGDSTNSMEEGWSGSERLVRDELINVVKDHPHRVAITCFASNIARLETCALAAKATGRKAVLVGRSLQKMYESARECGYLDTIPPFLYDRELPNLPRNKTLIICTGSQGESKSALSRIAFDQHPVAKLEEGDVVVYSSRVIPGNEKEIAVVHNQLVKQKIEVITAKHLDIHVSGHPYRDELRQMYEWVRPRMALPVHGEVRHQTAHAELAAECGVPFTFVPQNGHILCLSEAGVDCVGVHGVRPCAVDGTVLIPLQDGVFKERTKLMHSGVVAATLVLGKLGELKDVRLSLQGIWYMDEEIFEQLEDTVYDYFEDLKSSKEVPSLEAIEEKVRILLRQEIFRVCGKKPVGIVHAVIE